MKTENELLSWIKKRRLAYTIATTSSSTSIETLGRKFFFCDGQPFGGAQFQTLKKLKEAARAAAAAGKITGRNRADFYKVNSKKFPTGTIGEYPCAEIDLKAAYPTAALRCGIIDEKLFALLMLQPKIFRTKLVGALASRKQVQSFDRDGKLSGRQVIFDPAGVAAWREICFTVGKRLCDLKKLDSGFLCFWVDNYWTQGYSPALCEMLSGFECNDRPDLLEFQNETGDTLKTKTSDGRAFVYPMANKPRRERKIFLDARERKRIEALTVTETNAPPSDANPSQ